MLKTEYEFRLPCGYVDERGDLHRSGVMRLAMAEDEVEPLKDARVRENEAFFGILLLSRVVVSLGSMKPVRPDIIRRLFSEDFAYLQELYVRINRVGEATMVETACPSCGTRFELDLAEVQPENTDG